MARQATWKADVLDERQIQKLVQIYSDEERRLSDLILRAIAAGRPTDTYTSFRHQISKELDRLRRVGVPAAQGIVRDSYNLGKREADRLLKEMGAHTSASFAFPHVHREAVNLLVQNVTTRLEDLNQVIGRRVSDTYRDIALESLRSQIIGTQAWRAASERYRDELGRYGITGFTDKLGRRWNMTAYVQMVARTTPMEAHLQGTCNRLLENGIDLVRVSDHVDPCEKCAPWEGKVLSITGQTPGYPTIAEARAQGLFHPNCRHATSGYLVPYLEEGKPAADQPIVPESPIANVRSWDDIFSKAGSEGIATLKRVFEGTPEWIREGVAAVGDVVNWVHVRREWYHYQRISKHINLPKGWEAGRKFDGTLAHEMGHFMDHMAGVKAGKGSLAYFSTTDELNVLILKERKKWRKRENLDTLRGLLSQLYPDRERWNNDPGVSHLGDILDAVTNGERPWGAGHGKRYWAQRKGHGEAAEIFANLFSFLVTNDAEALENARRIFPEMTDAFLKHIQDAMTLLK